MLKRYGTSACCIDSLSRFFRPMHWYFFLVSRFRSEIQVRILIGLRMKARSGSIHVSEPELWIVNILVRIRIRILLFSFVTLKMSIKISFSYYSFLNVHLCTSVFKDKKSLRSHKTEEIKVFIFFPSRIER